MKRLAEKPFVLLGVNSDSDRDEIKKVIRDEKITWSSWWNGGGPDGSISQQWQLSTWPTIYVLDQKGIVRYRDTDGGAVEIEAIEKVIDQLLQDP